MNGHTEKPKSANQRNQHVQYVKDYMNTREKNLHKGSDEDYSPRAEDDSEKRGRGSGRFKSQEQPKGVKRSDQESSDRKPPRGRGNIMNAQPSKMIPSIMDMKPSNIIPGNGIPPFTNNPGTGADQYQDDQSSDDESPDGSDSDLTKGRGAKRYSNLRRTRPSRQPSVPPFQHPTTAPFQQISPLLSMPSQFSGSFPLPVPITLVDAAMPIMTTAQAFPTYTMAGDQGMVRGGDAFPTYTVAGDQGFVRGGVTYFNQPGSEISEMRGGVTYFNPPAQNILLQQQSNAAAQNLLLQQQMFQRQTSAIPIVNPTQPNCIPIQNLSNL